MYTWVYHYFHGKGEVAEIASFFSGLCISYRSLFEKGIMQLIFMIELKIFVSQQVVPQLESKTGGDQDGTWGRPFNVPVAPVICERFFL